MPPPYLCACRRISCRKCSLILRVALHFDVPMAGPPLTMTSRNPQSRSHHKIPQLNQHQQSCPQPLQQPDQPGEEVIPSSRLWPLCGPAYQTHRQQQPAQPIPTPPPLLPHQSSPRVPSRMSSLVSVPTWPPRDPPSARPYPLMSGSSMRSVKKLPKPKQPKRQPNSSEAPWRPSSRPPPPKPTRCNRS